MPDFTPVVSYTSVPIVEQVAEIPITSRDGLSLPRVSADDSAVLVPSTSRVLTVWFAHRTLKNAFRQIAETL